jgi:hypothetical protein
MKRRPQVVHLDALPQGVLVYTKPQMAAALQVSLRCLCDMMRRGEIRYLKLKNRFVRFVPEDVLRQLIDSSLVGNGEGRSEGGQKVA